MVGAMIIRHLPFFAIVAEEENLQRAARRLGVTQPALSRRIQDLEAELGLPLFDRSSGRLKLTEKGRLLGREARRLVDEVQELTRTIAQRSDGGHHRLAIGLNERTMANTALAHAIKRFRADNPAVELAAAIVSSVQQAAALREGRLDLAIMYVDRDPAPLKSRVLLEPDPLLVAIPDGHRLARLGKVSIADLADENLIWPSRDRIPVLCEALTRLWREAGVEPRVTTEIYSGEAALHAVTAGLGIAIVRRSSCIAPPAGVLTRSVRELARDPVPLMVVWSGRFETPALRRFLSVLGQRRIVGGRPRSTAAASA